MCSSDLVVLSFLWNRLVLSRLRVLLCHINWMSRGTWKASVPVRHNDEIGELTRAFNQMGERLTATVRQEAAASKLAAMALLGQHLVKNVSLAHDHLHATTMMLRRVKERDEAVSDPILWNLEAVISTLERIPAQFEEDFDHQFREHTSKTTLRDRNPV